jgi:acetyl esterase/lipase
MPSPLRRFRLACTISILLFLPGIARPDPSGKPEGGDEITVLHDIPYRDRECRACRLDLAMQKDSHGKARPGIVVIHGGGWIEGDKSSFASNRFGVPGNIEDFARRGFVGVTINYRLAGEAPFPAALEDCQSAVRWLRSHARDYDLDPAHIGVFGNSAGGNLALLLGMAGKEAGADIQAIVSDSGPIDLLDQYQQGPLREVIGRFLGGPPEGERINAYKRASPMYQINGKLPPTLLIYGGADSQVPVETADRFVVALNRAGLKDLSYYRLGLVDHCPYSLVRVSTLQPVVNDFFVRTLK